jgi:Cof subfamily protein (haloacid dehalogenase superfamily)
MPFLGGAARNFETGFATKLSGMPVRLIAVDIDNTLFTSDRIPHPKSVAAIQRAVQSGVTVLLASGRIGPSVKLIAEAVGLGSNPRICCNGADVVGHNDEPVYHWSLSAPSITAVAEYAAEEGIHLNLYTQAEILFVTETPWGDVYRQRVGSIEPAHTQLSSALESPILKALMLDDADAIARHRANLEQRLGEDARLTESEPEYLEVLPVGVSKGLALKTLCERLGIAQEETAAIGDYLNDLEMIQWAGVGAAVQNAHPTLRQHANRVVSSNDDGGVGEFIDSLV